MRVVFVHGACVRDGAWWWHRTAELLAQRGVASVAPGLPSCGETGSTPGPDGPGLSEDVDAVGAVLRGSDEPTVVVAHSYGGIVTAEAAAGVDAVRHLLLVSSYLPEVGESLSSFGRSPGPAPFLAGRFRPGAPAGSTRGSAPLLQSAGSNRWSRPWHPTPTRCGGRNSGKLPPDRA